MFLQSDRICLLTKYLKSYDRGNGTLRLVRLTLKVVMLNDGVTGEGP